MTTSVGRWFADHHYKVKGLALLRFYHMFSQVGSLFILVGGLEASRGGRDKGISIALPYPETSSPTEGGVRLTRLVDALAMAAIFTPAEGTLTGREM